MFYDAISLYDARHSHVQQPIPLTPDKSVRTLAQEADASYKTIDEAHRQPAFDRYQTNPSTKMVVGDWYDDEFGNPTREIKAFD
jgi:hypothetical protein